VRPRAEAAALRGRLLTVRHLTIYRYGSPVGLGEHRMMFRPRASHDVRLVSSRLEIRPQPSELRWLHDVFDNSVAIATFTGRTRELRFDSTTTLEHFEGVRPKYVLEAGAEQFPFEYADDERPYLAAARTRLYPDECIREWAGRFVPASGSIHTRTLLDDMARGIKEQFAYLRRTEKGVQTPAETLERGSGSCRDFALLMMEAVRALGLAARFVSGYIFVPESRPVETVGGGSTHAWMQVYLPGAGWVDFDPTNSIIGNRNLIRVAVAWDPKHALPLWGSFIGSARSFVGMDVTVSVTEEAVVA